MHLGKTKPNDSVIPINQPKSNSRRKRGLSQLLKVCFGNMGFFLGGFLAGSTSHVEEIEIGDSFFQV